MRPETSPEILLPASLGEALASLGERGATPLAGGTWVMRAPLRREPFAPAYVGLSRIPELSLVEVTDDAIAIGAAVTHADLANALAGFPEFAGLRLAAGSSANPAVRSAATVGGNLCTADFAAADLVPALLSLDATVELAGPAGSRLIPLPDFLAQRTGLLPGHILTKVVVARSGQRTAHARLPLRKAGDYPVAIVSLALRVDAMERIGAARIAVGSVEATARRWTALEDALVGEPLDGARTTGIAGSLLASFNGRDGVEAPGWYRVRVLPALAGRAVASLVAA